MELTDPVAAFVSHFGEMGSRWGMNRTVGQICALLVISEEALNADEICEALGFSRSNTSMGLKELQSWNLLRSVPRPGSRKDYFTVPEDMWEIARILIEERRKREIDPTLSLLRNILLQDEDLKKDQEYSANSYALAKIEEMHEFVELIVAWANDMQRMQSKDLLRLLKLGSRVKKVLDFGEKFKS